MGFFFSLFCFVFTQVVFGQIPSSSGQNHISNTKNQNLLLSISDAINSTTSDEANTTSTFRNARNAAFNNNFIADSGNTNIANVNFANGNLINTAQVNHNGVNNIINNANSVIPNQVNTNIANVNPNFNLRNGNVSPSNIASSNLAHLANAKPGIKLMQSNLQNLGYNSISQNFGNSKIANGNTALGLTSKPYRPTPNVALFATQPKAMGFKQLSNSVTPNPIQNNIASNLGISTNPNIAGGIFGINSGRGNSFGIARNKFSTSMLPGKKFSNSMLPGSTFAISGNPFTVLTDVPGNFGLSVVADVLEVDGRVAVSGKMPLYGTVSLSGNLPIAGASVVNYACNSKRNF